MKTKKAVWGVGYSLFQVLQGMILHPYPTMRQVVRDRVFWWMTLSPVFLWICAVMVWRIAAFLFFSLILYVGVWMFLALWFTVGIALYQILLGYLLIRFWWVVRTS